MAATLKTDTRQKIIDSTFSLISTRDVNEISLQDIANAVQLSQSAVSHQLRVLKDTKLVRFRRDGKTVYYALDDDHVRSILSMGMDHIEE